MKKEAYIIGIGSHAITVKNLAESENYKIKEQETIYIKNGGDVNVKHESFGDTLLMLARSPEMANY